MFSFAILLEVSSIAIDMGVARGYLDLDFSSLKKGAESAVQELKKLERQDSLLDSELNRLRQTAISSGKALDEQALRVKQISSELQTAKERIQTYRKGIDDLQDAVKQAALEQKGLSEKIESTTAAQKAADERLRSLSPAYKEVQKEIRAAAEKYGTESEECQKVAKSHENLIAQYQKASGESDVLRNQLTQLESRQNLVTEVTRKAKDQMDEYQISLNQAQAEVASLTLELKTAESQTVSFGDTLMESGTRMMTAADKLSGIGNKLTLGITTPLVAIGTTAIKVGNDFEAQMSRVSAIAGAYGDDLEKLRDQAIELGAETSFSATSAAEAMENLASAGFSTEEIMQAMPGMLNLAASSGEDLASSADIAASTLRGFQMEASQAGHVADVLAKNAADTNAAISDTGLAMKYIAPIAQSVGWSLEEVTVAIGKMADAGIKGEQAGTTLRGALTRLMKPTADMQESMDELGVSFYDSQGKMKSLSTIVDDLQSATATLTDEQRDNCLAVIFGTEALSGMKVLMSSSKEELDHLTDGLRNADGAAEKMANTMLDNTKGSIEEMNGSLETAGITIQKQLAPWITKGAGLVTDLANQFSELDENTQGTILSIAGIAAASGPATKAISSVTGGVGKLITGTGSLIKDLGKISAAKKAAESLGEIGDFSLKSVEDVSSLSKVLTKFASPAGAAALVVGAAAGIGIGIYQSMQQAKQAAIDADLEDRFGTIALSLEEVEDIAARLTTTDWTMQVDAVISAKGDLDTLRDQVLATVTELDKFGWKINMGFKLSEDDNQSFRSEAESFVQDSIAYMQQKQYTATLAVNAFMTPGTQSYENVRSFVDEFYAGSQKEMQDLGNMMAAEVDKALADGVITQDEYLNIQSIQAKLQELINQTENAQYKAKIKSMQMQVEGGKLTSDSFQKIMDTAGEQLQSQIEAADQAFLEVVTPLQMQLEQDPNFQDEYDEAMRQAQENLNRQKGELILQNVMVGVETLQGNYEQELNTFATEFQSTLQDIVSEKFVDGGVVRYSVLEAAVMDDFRNVDEAARGSAQELLDSMKPQTEQLEEIAKSYQEAGQIPPENIRKGLENIYQLQMMAGNTDYLFKFLAKSVSESPEMQQTLLTARKWGQDIPNELAEGLRDLYGLQMVEKNGTYMWEKVGETAQSSTQIMQDLFRQYGIELPESLAKGMSAKSADTVTAVTMLLEELEKGTALKKEDLTLAFSSLGFSLPQELTASLAEKEAEVQQQTIQLLANIEGAEQLKKEELTELFWSLGMDVPGALIESVSEKEPDVQAKMVDLIAQMQTAENENREDLLVQMLELGRDVDANLCLGISENLGLVEDETTGMVTVIDQTTDKAIAQISPEFANRLRSMGAKGFNAMDKEISKADLNAPDIKDLSTQPVKEWLTKSQSYLNSHPLTSVLRQITQSVSGSLRPTAADHYSDGGIVQQETLSWIAENDQPEAVIPLSASKQSRGVELWIQAGKELGIIDAVRNSLREKNHLLGNGADSQQLAAALARELRRAPIEVNPQFHVRAGDVYLEKEPVGHSLAPIIDTELSQIQENRRRGG